MRWTSHCVLGQRKPKTRLAQQGNPFGTYKEKEILWSPEARSDFTGRP